jgi:ketosteroid isomerase-like protein
MTDPTLFPAAWTGAERTGDTARLAELLTDDFVGVGPLRLQPPQAGLARPSRGRALRYDTFAVDELDVRAHGPVTVVTARQTAPGTYAGRPLPQQRRDTIVAVSDGTRRLAVRRLAALRLAALHMSFIADTPVAPPLTP